MATAAILKIPRLECTPLGGDLPSCEVWSRSVHQCARNLPDKVTAENGRKRKIIIIIIIINNNNNNNNNKNNKEKIIKIKKILPPVFF